MDSLSFFDAANSLERFGLLVERCPDGVLRANVPHVQYHSLSGFECGHGVAGPADLALSVMHALIPPLPEEIEKLQRQQAGSDDKPHYDRMMWSVVLGPNKVRVTSLAYLLHQEFKNQFIARIPPEADTSVSR